MSTDSKSNNNSKDKDKDKEEEEVSSGDESLDSDVSQEFSTLQIKLQDEGKEEESPEVPVADVVGEKEDKGGKQGYFETKTAKKGITLTKGRWKLSWVVLVGGSLHFYKNYEKTEPSSSMNLSETDITDYKEEGRDYSISLKSSHGHKYFNASSAQELTVWRELFTKAKSLDHSPPPVRAIVPRAQRTQGTLFRAKKHVAGRAATTKMGESLLMKLFGEEMHHLFLTVKKVVTKHHSKQVASRVHKLLIKLTIKIAFQFDKKNLSVEDLVPVDKPLREALELLSKYYNARVRRLYARKHVDEQCFVRVEQLAKEAERELSVKLAPYMTPKNLNNLHFLFESLTSAAFLARVWDDNDLPDELDEIDDAITAYTQFHF